MKQTGYSLSAPQTWFLVCALFIFGIGAECVAQKNIPAGDELRVLFIGNSLTYYNNLPEIVESLARSGKKGKLVCETAVAADFSLEDHWNKGRASKLISKEKWDYVILQQGPSASVEGRKLLLEYSRMFAGLIVQNGAKPALYMVWPSEPRRQDFDRAVESYRLAAKEVKGVLFPVGEAWRAAWKRDPDLKLYSPDGLHPTVAGSYLAALVIYQQLYGETPVGLPYKLKLHSGTRIEISEDQARILQLAAADANERFGQKE